MQFNTFCSVGDSMNPTTSQSCGILSDMNDHGVKVKVEPIDNKLVSDASDHEVKLKTNIIDNEHMSDTSDCVIKVKTEPIDSEPVKTHLPEDNVKTWVKIKDISLTCHDKDILEKGEKLSDKHINFAQRILKAKFPKINGLRLTLLQDKSHKEPTNNALQIFHTGGDHWICATTIGVSGKRVLVYDSAYTKWDESALCLLKKQFRCSPSNVSVLKGVQKQQGGKECGLYAIANATSIALGKDPLKLHYNEALMREHLVHCFSNKDLEQFP